VLRWLVAAVLGVLLGIGGARYQQLGLWTLLPWGLAGVFVGSTPSRRRSLLAGAVFGFVLVFTFMIAAYTGVPSVRTRLPAFAVLGLFGAACGLVLGAIGSTVRSWATSANRQH
jgi:hypothetical protein